MGILDIVVIMGYFLLLILVGLYVAKKYVKSGEDAAVAGRDLGIFLGGVGKAANSAGGSSSVGGTSWGYQFGIVGSWYAVSEGLSYITYLPFVKQIWRIVHRGRMASIGAVFGYRWGKFARIFAGLMNALAYTGFTAAQIIATGTIIHVLLGWNYIVALLVSTAVVIFYCVAGGLRAIVITDVIQMSLIIVGLFIILPTVIFGHAGDVGGIEGVWSRVPDFMTNLAGDWGWSYVIGAILIPCFFMPLTLQADYQYQASMRNQDTAFKSYIMVPFLYIPVSIMVVLMGMAAFLMYGDTFMDDGNIVLPTLIQEFLPTGLIGLLLAAILSATMSTSSTCLLCATTCFVEDVVHPLKKTKVTSEKEGLKEFRICMIILGIATTAVTLWATDIISIITLGYAASVGGLFVPVIATIFMKKATKAAVQASMIVGAVVYVAVALPWLYDFWLAKLGDIIADAPLVIALPIAAVTFVIVNMLTFKKGDHGNIDIYFTDEWEKSPNNWEKNPELLKDAEVL
jgi:SSS family solute:Na+ symporter